jgi:hypothetical protein
MLQSVTILFCFALLVLNIDHIPQHRIGLAGMLRAISKTNKTSTNKNVGGSTQVPVRA